MRSQQRREFKQQSGCRLLTQSRDQSLELPMLSDQAGNQWVVCHRRKKYALLEFEMIGELELVSIDGLGSQVRHIRCRRILAERTFRKHAQGKAVVVLLGKRNQTAIAEHMKLPNLSIAGSSTDRSAA